MTRRGRCAVVVLLLSFVPQAEGIAHAGSAGEDTTAAAIAALADLDANTERSLAAVEQTLDGIGKTPFPETVAQLRREHLAMARERLRQAGERARDASKARDGEAQTALLRQATGHALAAATAAAVLQHGANVEAFAAFADESGMSFGQLRAIHADQYRRVVALLGRTRETDPDRLARLTIEASDQLLPEVERLSTLIDAVDRGAVLSRRVILAADLILLATAMHSVVTSPAFATRSAAVAPRIGGISAGGAAVATRGLRVGLSQVRVAELIQALVNARALGTAAAGVGASTMMMTAAPPASPPMGGAGGGRFVSTQTGDTTRNAEILRMKMQKAGVKIGPGEQVHHIVPSTHPYAQSARRILDKFEIDINDANNGVPIPKDLHYGQRLHSRRGIDWVTDTLAAARTREQAVEALRKIADRIRSGSVPLP